MIIAYWASDILGHGGITLSSQILILFLTTLEKQEKFFIYITHLHWNHFHGPTFRKIKNTFKNCEFIIPIKI